MFVGIKALMSIKNPCFNIFYQISITNYEKKPNNLSQKDQIQACEGKKGITEYTKINCDIRRDV